MWTKPISPRRAGVLIRDRVELHQFAKGYSSFGCPRDFDDDLDVLIEMWRQRNRLGLGDVDRERVSIKDSLEANPGIGSANSLNAGPHSLDGCGKVRRWLCLWNEQVLHPWPDDHFRLVVLRERPQRLLYPCNI